MQKTLTFTITLDELDARLAAEVLAQDGLTPEGVIRLILERTAREGALPIKKTKGRRHRAEAVCPGLFVQGDLWAEDEPSDSNPATAVEPADTKLRPSLITMNALQEAQAKLRWRARERASAEGGSLRPVDGAPLELLETKQFRFDKSSIVGDARRPAIIQALEALFTEITERRTPAGALPVDTTDCLYVPVAVDGDSLGIIYEAGEGEVCLVRYGHPESLLQNPGVLPACFMSTK